MGLGSWLTNHFKTPEQQFAELRMKGEAWAEAKTTYAPATDATDDLIEVQAHPSQRGRSADKITSVVGPHPDDPRNLSATFHLRRFSVLRGDCSKLLKPEELTDVVPDERGLVQLVEFKPDWMDMDAGRFAELQAKLRDAEPDTSWPSAVAMIQPPPPKGGGGIGQRIEDATTLRFMP